MRQITFTSTSVDLADFTKLSDQIPAERADQRPSVVALRVCAQSEDSSGSAVIRFILARKGRALFKKDVTATVTAVRTDFDGAGGSYVCTLDEEFVDIAGAYQTGDDQDGAEWYVGCATLTTINDITVQVFPVRNQ